MKRLKRIGKKLLFVHWSLAVLLAVLAAAGLAWVFLGGNETSYWAYLIYVLSAYALTVDCITLFPWIIRLVKAGKEKRADMDRKEKRFRASLFRSFWIKLVYAAFNLISSVAVASAWMGSMGLYYLVLAVIHLVLIRYAKKLAAEREPAERHRTGWNGFRLCGLLLLLLHLTTTGVVFQMVWQGHGKEYGGYLIFANAAYTFYRLIEAVVSVVQHRRNPNPIWGAAQNIDLSEAMMSLFFLQSAMFAAFGGDFEFQHLMNSLTGGAVCCLVVLGAVGMILHGGKRIKQDGEREYGE